jgi:hypothetical protein
MKTTKHAEGFRITKYDNDDTCYVYFYTNISKSHVINSEIGFAYAKKKFGINEENYTVSREEGKTIYTRK